MSISTNNLVVGGNLSILGNIVINGNINTVPSSNLLLSSTSSSNGIIVSSGQLLVQSNLLSTGITSGSLVVNGGIATAGSSYIGGNINIIGSLTCPNFFAINIFQQQLTGALSYTSLPFSIGSGYKLINFACSGYVNSNLITCYCTVTIISSGNIILDTYSKSLFFYNTNIHKLFNHTYVTGNSILAQSNVTVNVSLTPSSIITNNLDYLSMTMLCLPF